MAFFNPIRKTLGVILANPACRHDLIMAMTYLLAVPTVILWHRRVWVIYAIAFLAHLLAAFESAALL